MGLFLSHVLMVRLRFELRMVHRATNVSLDASGNKYSLVLVFTCEHKWFKIPMQLAKLYLTKLNLKVG